MEKEIQDIHLAIKKIKRLLVWMLVLMLMVLIAVGLFISIIFISPGSLWTYSNVIYVNDSEVQ